MEKNVMFDGPELSNELDIHPEKPNKVIKLIKNLYRSKLGFIGLLIVVVASFVAIFAPLIAPHNPTEIDVFNMLVPPAWAEGGSMEHILGTDNLGRDVLSRVIYGSQISLLVGILAVVVAGSIGLVIGLIAGYYGKLIDNILMRVVDAFLSIPNVLFILVILGVLGPSLLTLILVIGFTNWIVYARLVRGEVLSIKELDFVKASISIGSSDKYIIFKHILPNIVSSFIIISALSVASIIILESSLSFLGLGVQQPTISWGGMLSEGRDYLATGWWISTFPGVAITITVLGIIFLGDWLRDVLDPRS